MTFHTYFTAFQTSAPRRITMKTGKMPQNTENQTIFSVFSLCENGKIAQNITCGHVHYMYSRFYVQNVHMYIPASATY